MSERYKPKDLYRERIAKGPIVQDPDPFGFQRMPSADCHPSPPQQTLCRLHGNPWRTCTQCGPVKVK